MKYIAIFTLAWLLSGCATNKVQVHYYLLHNPTAKPVHQANSQAAIQLRLAPVQLADYLQQSSLVMQTGNFELNFAQQHIWAEALHKSLAKALIDDLNQQADIYATGSFTPNTEQQAITLTLDVTHLIPNDKEVVFSGQFWLSHQQQTSPGTPFYYSTPLTQGGYHQAVGLMRELVSELARDIAQAVRKEK